MYSATIIFYDTLFDGEVDSKRLKRVARMIHRENLPLQEERFEHTPCIFSELLKRPQDSHASLLEIPGAVEVTYFASFQLQDPKKLFALVAWLRSYAEYCGMCSRLFRWEAL